MVLFLPLFVFFTLLTWLSCVAGFNVASDADEVDAYGRKSRSQTYDNDSAAQHEIVPLEFCSYPSDAFSLLVEKQCPAAGPLCIIDEPFDFLSDIRYRCATASVIVNNTVEIRSASDVLELLGEQVDNIGLPLCTVTAFYSPSCAFSAQMAPFLNALPRVYPQLRVIASDATDYSKLNSRYGISGTPTIIFWLDGVALARMDEAPFSLEALNAFIERWTDLEPVRSVSLNQHDFEGPLPSRVVESSKDWHLLASSVTLLFSLGYFFGNSKYGKALWEMARANYIEANEIR